MSAARNRLIATVDHIKTLKIVIACLVAVIIAQWIRTGSLQEVRRVYVPPNLSQGMVTTFDEVPLPTIYTFSYYIFQQLNRWKSNGKEDYPNKIYRLQGFFTPSCLNALKDDMNEKSRLGELRKRVRMVQELPGRGYDSGRVRVGANGAWTVTLDLNLVETIGNHEVKNIDVRWELPVVKFDVDREVNPWGLAIACDKSTKPTLLSAGEI